MPLARHVDALVTVRLVAAVLWVMLGFETRHDDEARRTIRAADHEHHHASQVHAEDLEA